jgi:hypothetical protein
MHHTLAYDLAARLWLPVLALIVALWLRALMVISSRANRRARQELRKAAEEEYQRELAKWEALR